MKTRIEDLRGRKFVGVAELAGAATAILSERAPVQERGTVTEYPDERTIRYYLSEGLLSVSDEKQGTASIFGYLQLLQLLVIKRLQAEHLPIRKIRELVEGRSQEELERLLPGIEKESNTRAEALSYLESLLTGPRRPAAPSRPRPSAQQIITSAAAAPPQPNIAAGAAQNPAMQAGTWERVQIEPGLELHVRDDYEMPIDANEENRIVASIIELFRRFRTKNRKRGKQP